MNTSGATPLAPHARGDVLDLPEQHGANLIEVNQVHPERLLLPDALGIAVGRDVSRIFSMRQSEVMLPGVAEWNGVPGL